ncbi:hypothetical protein Br6_05130 [Rhodococcus sp. Br-6]|nr:hypothetical protein Br6_05130 [Rhodococcus sp. Br-6]
MHGTSQGSACPDQLTTFSASSLGESRKGHIFEPAIPTSDVCDSELANAIAAAKANIELVTQINANSGQLGRTWSLPVPPEMQSKTPVWSSRMHWQRQVRKVLNDFEGISSCAKHHVDPERVYAVAITMARSADHRTGRRVAASREFLANRAGVSITVLKRARRVLSELGMAQEMVRGRLLRTIERWAAEAHHGRRQTKATSVWALVSPRTVAAQDSCGWSSSFTYPQMSDRGPQSLACSFSSSTSVRKYKTTRARTHARRGHAMNLEPRPIALQRAAGELSRLTPALNGVRHIGSVCDALRAHSVDVERWTGRDIARALSDDTKKRGWNWPTAEALDDPVAFLRWRLARIDWSGPSYSERATAVKKLRDEERLRAASQSERRLSAHASDVTRQAAMRQIRKVLIARTNSSPRSKVSIREDPADFTAVNPHPVGPAFNGPSRRLRDRVCRGLPR